MRSSQLGVKFLVQGQKTPHRRTCSEVTFCIFCCGCCEHLLHLLLSFLIMHPPQHTTQPAQQHHLEERPPSPVSQDRPVIQRSATQQRYAKSRFLMRLPRRHVVQRISAAARDIGEDGDHHHNMSLADDFDFVDSLLEANEDTAFIDNLIGASTRKKQEDLSGYHPNHNSSLELAKQPLRRIRLVGRRVMYSLGTFILFYSFLSFWQSRKSKFSWRAYKENLHQNFASIPDQQHQQQQSLRGGGGVRRHHNNPDFNSNNNPQNRMMYDASLSQQRNHLQALSPLSQNINNNNNNLQQQGLWSSGRDDLAMSRLSPQQGRYPAAFNGYTSNNNNIMQQQPLGGYTLGNPSLLRGPDGFTTTSAWGVDNKGSMSMGMLDGMESGNLIRRPSQHSQYHQQQSRNGVDSGTGDKKSRKGWTFLRKKQKADSSSSSSLTSSFTSTGKNRFDDGSLGGAAAAAAEAVKSASLASSAMLMVPAVGGGGMNTNFVMGTGLTEQLRRPYAHGYD